jgi:hypothetical protein
VSLVVEKPEDAREVVERTLLHARSALASFRDYQASRTWPWPLLKVRKRSFFDWLLRFAAELSLCKVRED